MKQIKQNKISDIPFQALLNLNAWGTKNMIKTQSSTRK